MSTSDKLKKAVAIYQKGETLKNTAMRAGLHYSLVYKHLRFANLLRTVRVVKGNIDPTPEEIAARCAEIQARWSVEETSRRWVGRLGIRRCPTKVLVPGRVA
jgi:lambda repressor-like predicted transcriptional regulator